MVISEEMDHSYVGKLKLDLLSETNQEGRELPCESVRRLNKDNTDQRYDLYKGDFFLY